MENAVSINHTKDNTIEFDLSIDGIKPDDLSVKFVVESKGVDLAFKAIRKNKKGDTWKVELPPLSMLKKEVYNFHVEVTCDGYYFEPMKGIVNVTGETKLFSGKLKNTTFDSENKTDNKKSEPAKKAEPAKKKVKESVRTQPVRGREKEIDQLARELMEGKDLSPEAIEERIEQKRAINHQDEKVLAILEEVGFKPNQKKHRPRISFIKSETKKK